MSVSENQLGASMQTWTGALHDDDYPQIDPGSGTSNTSDSNVDDDGIPAITHSVVFKCIGAHKEGWYQDVLALAAKKRRERETVPVRVQEEQNNPVDARAIAFMYVVVQSEWSVGEDRVRCLWSPWRSARGNGTQEDTASLFWLSEVRCTV